MSRYPKFIYATDGIFRVRIIRGRDDLGDVEACTLYNDAADPEDVPMDCWVPLDEFPSDLAERLLDLISVAVHDDREAA